MTDVEAITSILDETVRALTRFDVAKLQSLDRQISEFAGVKIDFDRESANRLMQQRSLLRILLQNCKTNLDVLGRLHDRTARDPWAQ